MDDCLFCKIVSNEVPSYKIYEDDNYLAFLDIFPTSEGHTLVIPKKHQDYVWDVENIGEMFEICKKLALHFREVSGSEIVYSLIHGEGVSHAHVHIIPRPSKEIGEKISKAFQGPKITEEEAKIVMEKYKVLSTNF